ncbi:MAG TPA: calcium-binding protein, partial [Acetobacteraceae bacterium]
MIGYAGLAYAAYQALQKAIGQVDAGDYAGAAQTMTDLAAAAAGGVVGADIGTAEGAFIGGSVGGVFGPPGAAIGAAAGALAGAVAGAIAGFANGPGLVHGLADALSNFLGEVAGALTGHGAPGVAAADIANSNTQISPLVLDLTGLGVNLTPLSSLSPYFDLSDSGFAHKIGWIGKGTGLLALDPSGGPISSGLQLFGTAGGAANGFAALAALAQPGATAFSAATSLTDPVTGQLYSNELAVWADANGNGAVDPDELFSLSQLGIVSISLQPVATDQSVAGNSINLTASYTLSDGTQRTIADVWFNNSLIYTKPDAVPALTPAVAALPEVPGSGSLAGLRATMAGDPTLLGLAQSFVQADTAEQPAQILSDVGNIMLEWADVAAIDPASRGSEFDARELSFLERYTGVAFYDPTYIPDLVGQPANPRWQSAIDLRQAWNTALDATAARLLLQSGYSLAEFTYDPDFDAILPASTFAGSITSLMQRLGDLSAGNEAEWGLALRVADAFRVDANIDADSYLASLQSLTSDSVTALASALLAGMQAAAGTSGRFDLTGPTHEATIYAGSQIELIQIHGEDSVDPATLGNTIIYNAGDGQLEVDEIDYSEAPSNALSFGPGITAAQVTVTADSAGNIYLTDGTTGDRVKLDNEMLWAGSGVQSVSFADGTTWTRQQILTLADTGTPGPDILYGTPDADMMDGRGAPAGTQDYLQGNRGADTFIYNPGYGALEINENTGIYTSTTATLRLGPGIAPSQLVSTSDSAGNLFLTDGIAGDQIKLDGMLNSSASGTYAYGVASVTFADGTTLTRQQVINLATTGVPGRTTLYGSNGPD